MINVEGNKNAGCMCFNPIVRNETVLMIHIIGECNKYMLVDKFLYKIELRPHNSDLDLQFKENTNNDGIKIS